MSWNAGLEVSSSHIAGSALMNSTISSQTGPAVTTTSANTVTNSSGEAHKRGHAALPAASHELAHHGVQPEGHDRGKQDRQQRAEREHREYDQDAHAEQGQDRAGGDRDFNAW